ncbi:MAG: hypothetical protein ABJB11_22105 [Ferruginibacter sp.]
MSLFNYHLVLLDKVAYVKMRAEYLYFFIIFFSFIALVLVVCMLLIVLQKKSANLLNTTITNQLEEWLMDVILEDAAEGHQFVLPTKIRLLLQTTLAKKVLLNELVKVKKSLSGVSGSNLEALYNQQSLYNISIKRLSSKKWHIKALGIQELAIMNYQQSKEMITTLTNDADAMVRMEAQTGMVRLMGYKGLQFFDNLAYPLSEWHQLNILCLLAHQPITEETGIYNWLNSPNASVVQFALKLIAEQHAIELHDDVVKCLNHSSEVVRKEAVLCLGQLPSFAAAEELNMHYKKEADKNIQLCIIHEFQKTGSDLDLPFLQPLQLTEDVDINLAAKRTVLYLQKNF